jgi:hypothetical protein
MPDTMDRDALAQTELLQTAGHDGKVAFGLPFLIGHLPSGFLHAETLCFCLCLLYDIWQLINRWESRTWW